MSYAGNKFYEEVFRKAAEARWTKARKPIANLDGEEWRACPSWPGYYASSLGRVRSEHQALRPFPLKSGHLAVCPSIAGKQKPAAVHRMVLDAWAGPPPAGYEARHLNGDPADNRPENLAWGSRLENQRDRARHGTTNGGARNGRAKVSEDTVRELWRLYQEGVDRRSLPERTGLPRPAINLILGGFRWNDVTGLPRRAR